MDLGGGANGNGGLQAQEIELSRLWKVAVPIQLCCM